MPGTGCSPSLSLESPLRSVQLLSTFLRLRNGPIVLITTIGSILAARLPSRRSNSSTVTTLLYLLSLLLSLAAILMSGGDLK